MLKNTKDKERVIMKILDQSFFSGKIIKFQMSKTIVLFKQISSQ